MNLLSQIIKYLWKRKVSGTSSDPSHIKRGGMNAYSVPLETELLNRETPAEVKKMQKRLIFLEGLVKELC